MGGSPLTKAKTLGKWKPDSVENRGSFAFLYFEQAIWLKVTEVSVLKQATRVTRERGHFCSWRGWQAPEKHCGLQGSYQCPLWRTPPPWRHICMISLTVLLTHKKNSLQSLTKPYSEKWTSTVWQTVTCMCGGNTRMVKDTLFKERRWLLSHQQWDESFRQTLSDVLSDAWWHMALDRLGVYYASHRGAQRKHDSVFKFHISHSLAQSPEYSNKFTKNMALPWNLIHKHVPGIDCLIDWTDLYEICRCFWNCCL